MKNYYLSKTEQELIRVLKSADTVTIQEIEGLFPKLSKDMIKKVLSSLVRKGYLYRLRRGIYLVNEEPGKPLIKKSIPNSTHALSGLHRILISVKTL